MSKMTVCGNEYKLAFNLLAWADMEEAGIEIDSISTLMQGGKDRVRRLAKVLCIMLNAALEKPEFDSETLLRVLDVTKARDYYAEIIETIGRAMKMTTDNPDEPKDMVLAEIQKKSGAEA